MKNIMCLAVFAFALSPTWVSAEDAMPKDSSNVAAAAMTGEETARQSTQMQERMLRMHEQMHKIMRNKAGVERERLIQEHRQMIEENMHMMHSMTGDADCESAGKTSKDM